MAFHTLTVAAVEKLCDDAAAVTFEVPDELRGDYAFAAGQSLALRRVVDGVEERRSYSICAPVGSAPRVGVREVPDGLFSRWLVREVRPGSRVEVQTPTGRFRADPAAGGRHLCVAAGSGRELGESLDMRLLDGFRRRGLQHVAVPGERQLVVRRFHSLALVSAPPGFAGGAEAIEDAHVAVSLTRW